MSTDPRTVDGYNYSAKTYHDHVNDPALSPLHEYYEKPAIRSLLPDLKGLRVLSLGCGSGEDTAWIKQQGAGHVIGIDISKELIAIAKSSYSDISFEISDIASYSYESESWDVVYASLAMHYVEDWATVFSKIANCLKPNGKFIFSANHPIETALEPFTTPTSRGVRIGREIDNVTEERKIWGDYMAVDDDGVRKRQNTIADKQVVYSYHRTFSDIMSAIRQSGLLMVDFIEPTPQAGMMEHNPEHYKQVLLTPKFFVCSLQKQDIK